MIHCPLIRSAPTGHWSTQSRPNSVKGILGEGDPLYGQQPRLADWMPCFMFWRSPRVVLCKNMIDEVQSRLFIRMHKIARFRAASLPDLQIARLVGMTRMGLAQIVARPEYRQLEKEVLQQTTKLMDEALAGNATLLKEHFAHSVPESMRALLDTVRQNKDLRSRLDAAKELLDRDPDRTFVKAGDANLAFSNGSNGQTITIPAAVFTDNVKAGAAIVSTTKEAQDQARAAAATIVPRALVPAVVDSDGSEDIKEESFIS